MKPSLNWVLILAPVSIVGKFVLHQDLLVFLTAAGTIIPLAGLIGRGTEELSLHARPRVGGLLNATFGNVTELIIAIFLILKGELDVVKASVDGPGGHRSVHACALLDPLDITAPNTDY